MYVCNYIYNRTMYYDIIDLHRNIPNLAPDTFIVHYVRVLREIIKTELATNKSWRWILSA